MPIPQTTLQAPSLAAIHPTTLEPGLAALRDSTMPEVGTGRGDAPAPGALDPMPIADIGTALADLAQIGLEPLPGGLQPMESDGLFANLWLGIGKYVPLNLTIVGTIDSDVLHGGAGDDTILDHQDGLYWAYDHDAMYGHGGNDTIIAGLGDDLLDGGDGNDELYGGFGDDLLIGGDGFDQLFGGGGSDTLQAGDGSSSVMYGGDGNDIIIGGEGVDSVFGGSHDDSIEGGAGNDWLYGDDVEFTHGNDIILGGAGDDRVIGQGGDDILDGGDGNDLVVGYSGDDVLAGGAGDDLLVGGMIGSLADGNDVLDGGAGDDVLFAYTGTNVMTGGSGADQFYCDHKPMNGDPFGVPANFGHNIVTDYNTAEGDTVQGAFASQVGGATHVYSNTNQLLFVLQNHDLATEGINLIW